MRIFITALTGILFLSLAHAASPENAKQRFDGQFAVSIELMMKNMIRSDITPGAIIAAPSRQDPDYFYHWVRDAALTVDAALDLYQSGYLNADQHAQMQNFFLDHVQFNQRIQQNSQKAEGLGEPKLSVEGHVYTLPWGRPQNDGPGLRASALTRIMKLGAAENWPNMDKLTPILYQAQLPTLSLIKSDLEFVSHNWRSLNFDLWEEVYGAHFYTLMAQRKALLSGIQTADFFMDFGASKFYREQNELINHELEKFWNSDGNYVLATLWSNNPYKSHLDTAVILGVLHSDVPGQSFSFDDDRILATFQKLKESFGNLYPINQNENVNVAFGRYTEDTYNGYETNKLGNPWVLTTAAAAEFLYRKAAHLAQESEIRITKVNQKFYSDIVKNKSFNNRLRSGIKISRQSREAHMLIQSLVAEADRYMDRILLHRNPDGSLSEQINRYSGYMQGAPNLTWSYASFITAKMARDRVIELLSKGDL